MRKDVEFEKLLNVENFCIRNLSNLEDKHKKISNFEKLLNLKKLSNFQNFKMLEIIKFPKLSNIENYQLFKIVL